MVIEDTHLMIIMEGSGLLHRLSTHVIVITKRNKVRMSEPVRMMEIGMDRL